MNGKWKYIYRAVDSEGNTLDFMLSAKRNKKTAKRFLKKVLKAEHNKQPRVINVDKKAAYPPAIDELKEDQLLEEPSELRQVKYLNNLLEKDHRSVKKITSYGLGYKSFHTAWRTIRGIEIMHMINKGEGLTLGENPSACTPRQVEGVSKKDILGQKKFVESVFRIATL